MIAEAEQVADDMFRYPFQLAFAEAFGDEGYGLPAGGLPHTLPAVSAADVRAWHRRALLGVRPTVLAVGDVDPERAIEELAGVFGDRTAPTARRSRSSAGSPGFPAETSRRCGWSGREKAQAALAMAFPGPARRDADRAAAQVWAAVASGLGGRLFEALRDRRSLAYTVVASAWQKARGGALLTYIATSPEREEEAREQMLIELERFTREPVNDAELRQAVNYLAGQAEVSRQNANAVAGEILDAWLSGSGLGELEDPAAPFRAVTAEDVHADRRGIPDAGAQSGRSGAGNRGRAAAGARRSRPDGTQIRRAQPAHDHLDRRARRPPAPGPRYPPGRSLLPARGVQHDVTVAAQHPDRDPFRFFPYCGWFQREHPDRSRRGDHHRREPVGVRQLGRDELGQQHDLGVVDRLHQARGGKAATASRYPSGTPTS